MSHTKSPWEYFRTSRYKEGKRPFNINDSDGMPVAGIRGSSLHQPDPEANALLIAAAPELLESLERLMVAIDTLPPIRNKEAAFAYFKCIEAIEKAKGVPR